MQLADLEQRARDLRAKNANDVGTPVNVNEGSEMSDTKTESTSAWGPLAAGVAGLLLGENGVFGKGSNSAPAVTPDQLGTALGNLQGSFQRDNLGQSINGISKDIGLAAGGLAIGITGVKDAVTGAAAQNALSLCGINNAITQGNASVISAIQTGFASSERLALQQALDAERSRATELRIALSESHNQASHTATQVLLQQVVLGKGAAAGGA